MGFDWDKYNTGGGGDFVTAAEKMALAESGIPFVITGVSERPSRFEHDTEYVLKIVISDEAENEGVEPGDRDLTFAKDTGAESRDRCLAGMIEYFAGPEADDIEARLDKVGRAWFVNPA